MDLPDGRRLGPADLQEIVALLQLEVGEDQRDGVPRLGQDGPGAVGVVPVLGGEVRAGDGAAGPPQSPSAGALRCGTEQRDSHCSSACTQGSSANVPPIGDKHVLDLR